MEGRRCWPHRQFQQLFACVPATGDGGVHVQEVARQGAAQCADFVGDGVIGVQDGADGKPDRLVGAPVDG
jgi:hypothetical protein